MRVALIRSDIGRVYLDDVENTSQRNFSSQAAGQSRYLEVPTDTAIASMLAGVALVTIQGSNTAATVDTTISNGTLLNIRATSTSAYTQIAVTSNATLAKATIVSQLNIGFANAGLPLVASLTGTNKVTINSTFGGPGAYVQISASSPSTAALQTVLGLSTSAVSGMTVATLKNTVYIGHTAIGGQTGTAATVASVVNGLATITGLTGMTAASVGHALTISGGASVVNNGTFRVVAYVSASSVVVANSDATATDSNNGSIVWTEYTSMSVDVSTSTLNTASALVATAQQTAFNTAVGNLIAPTFVETGSVLLSFALGKLSKLYNAAFTPGSPQVTTEARVGLPAGAAVAIVASDGVTPFTL